MKAEMAIMNSDMINDNNSIYIPSSKNGLEFYKYPIVGDLFTSLRSAICKYNCDTYTEPRFVLVPYIRYNNFMVEKDTCECIALNDYINSLGLTIHFMISDYAIDKIK